MSHDSERDETVGVDILQGEPADVTEDAQDWLTDEGLPWTSIEYHKYYAQVTAEDTAEFCRQSARQVLGDEALLTRESGIEPALKAHLLSYALLCEYSNALQKMVTDLKHTIINSMERDGLEDLAVEGGGVHVATATRKGYVRTSWDTKGLDGYALAHPEILTLRKSTPIDPVTVISISEVKVK